MSDMNQLIRDRATGRRTVAEDDVDEMDDTPAPQPAFGGRVTGTQFGRPAARRRSLNDRVHEAFDNRPRAGTYRIGG